MDHPSKNLGQPRCEKEGESKGKMESAVDEERHNDQLELSDQLEKHGLWQLCFMLYLL